MLLLVGMGFRVHIMVIILLLLYNTWFVDIWGLLNYPEKLSLLGYHYHIRYSTI